jgi:hypothetical protein
MRKFTRLFIGVSATSLLLLAMAGSLAHGNDRGEAKATIGGAHISIDYGRPSLKGRDPLKMLQPGRVWRIGSDASTTIESDKDLNFGGTTVPKGKHILLAHLVESGKWTLVVSTKPYNQYGPSAKIAEVPITLNEASDSVETVTIQLAEKEGRAVIEIAWGKMRLVASFTPAS